LNYTATLPQPSGLLLTAAAQADVPADRIYPLLWRRKAAAAQVTHRRLLALARTPDRDTQQLAQELLDKRRAVAPLPLAPPDANQDRGKLLAGLTRDKEALERRLAAKLPALAREQQLDVLGPADLARQLPNDAAFIDLLLYSRPGEKAKPRDPWEWRYVAF